MNILYDQNADCWVILDEDECIGTLIRGTEDKAKFWFNPAEELMYSEIDCNKIAQFLNYVNSPGVKVL